MGGSVACHSRPGPAGPGGRGPYAYYVRIVPTLETAAEDYLYLNRMVALGFADRRPEGPHYHFIEIL